MNKIYYLFIVFACNFQTLLAQDENPYLISCDTEKDGENCAVVIAKSGLKIRTKPSFDGKTLAVASFGGKITRLAPNYNFTDFIYTPDSIRGNWERVRYGKIEGYAFNSFFGEGIMKIKEKYRLLMEDEAYCWNDCYGSIKEHYNYYALLKNKDGKSVELKKFTPTFACSQGDMGGISINCPDKRPSHFILVTKDEISEGKIHSIDKQAIIKGREDENPNEINQKVKIPETNWVLEVKEEKRMNEDSEYTQNVLYLRDTKSGIKQRLSSKDEFCNYAKLIWCGDLDRDGIMDFMIQTSDGEESNGTSLFLSRDAPQGKLVKPAGTYSYGDCC
jgi:hypothetical protein